MARMRSIYHFFCLGNFNCFPDVLICGVLVTPFQIVTDTSLEQYTSLLNNSDFLTDRFSCVFCNIFSVHIDLSVLRIVESWDQRYQC